MKIIRAILLLQIFILFYGCSASKEESITIIITEPVVKTDPLPRFNEEFALRKFSFQKQLPGRIDSVVVDSSAERLLFYFDNQFFENPFREETIQGISQDLKDFFEKEYPGYSVRLFARGLPLESLVPNYYRTSVPADKSRNAADPRLLGKPIVKNISSLNNPTKGLSGRNILLWQSHGWYYSNTSKRWEWQRPRLFQTVEDKLPLSFTIPYIIPMLENAGANVFVPRERDIQKNMVILDNDAAANSPAGKVEVKGKKSAWKTGSPGFRVPPDTVFDNSSPFKQGSYLQTISDITGTASVEYIPNIPETGFYSVSVSFNHSVKSSPSVLYTVTHLGGEDEYEVNQRAGGSTWIYLGTFKFGKGVNPFSGKVTVSNKTSQPGEIVSTDAVKFGGGMGYIARDSVLSNRPKYIEAARYWLQFAGMPDTLVYSLNNNTNDYNDDYQSRSEYGNYLFGKPFGPNRKRDSEGLGIPIHSSLAFHTDAGITNSDTVIGTLSIYSSTGADSLAVFPDSVSRFANRDLADILQTQLVEDIAASFSTHWNRRQLRDSRYSEAFRPNFPAVLLELLSHQNFSDIKFATDPRFKFVASRSIYKAFLKFLSAHYGFDYVVQPLPVDHMQISITGDSKFFVSWNPVADPLEPSAKPDYYIVYTRIDSGDFDNGVRIDGNRYVFGSPQPGKIYSFKVTAVNEGGESFPSEILSAALTAKSSKKALIVNAFDRVSGPMYFSGGSYSGFMNIVDEGVPDKVQLDYSGPQYDFVKRSAFNTNDAPGHGASTAANETDIIAGNTFDFTYSHGEALLKNGVSFTSVSDEIFVKPDYNLTEFVMVDLLAGEERTTPGIGTNAHLFSSFHLFDVKTREKITSYLSGKGKLFISGSHIGKELFTVPSDSILTSFATGILRMNNFSPNASSDGQVFPCRSGLLSRGGKLEFNNKISKNIYRVESPDAFYFTKDAEPLLRYSENSFCAAYGYRDKYHLIVMGFPFETVTGTETRTLLMKAILKYLEI
ncbi:MAG: fibronectin type III domain-containing protein [Ignavibacteriaceae bacterium]|nr:fibronectin type III domain-containing protein [Ignavibacteriaceae bacterium]